MKYLYLVTLSLSVFTGSLFAQKKQLQAYAITSGIEGQQAWTEIKRVNLLSGEVTRNVFQNTTTKFEVLSARNGKSLPVREEVNGNVVDNGQLPFSSFAAACAYDKKHNRLYYTPMYINQLRYFDLNSSQPKVFYFEGENFSKADNLQEAGNHITRMVIGADGNGYAISNDGQHFIRFSTGKDATITDLGPLYDAASNTDISIHNKCSSWGGDMVAAADGSLYVVTANHAIFRIDVSNKEATYITSIKGLPQGYSTNGAVVSDDGKLVVGSAASTESYYEVDMKTWQASRIEGSQGVPRTADLANGNLAFDKEQLTEPIPLFNRQADEKNFISIFPNPVKEGVFRTVFDVQETGRYEMQLFDLYGKAVLQKSVNITYTGQAVEVVIGKPLAAGTYLLKVTSASTKTVQTDKLIIE
jgi:hypothetical protein